ncbi:caveolin-1 [Patella vulgata]|uniref:caveolin-1 n=1 Tax=Patella vulgata TaxID=6465 RepID=UPI00217F8F19|nr:caveolin-1 [Patella vulgata]
MDPLNRDPNDINDHLKVQFEDVLAEPDGARSFECCWNCSRLCFNCSKGCCYKFLTLICALPFALCWGCSFAMITFQHVWHFTPLLRAWMINLGCMQKCFGTLVNCCLAPICEACGLMFSTIHVRQINDSNIKS